MTPFSIKNMRAATDATRAGNLTEATRLIQTALTGKAAPPEASATAITASRIDKTAEILEPEIEAPRARRKRHPMGEAMRAFGQGRAMMMPATATPAATMPLADGAQFISRSVQSAEGTREYRLYIPSGTPRGLIVMLHGCQQNPEDFALGTGMNVIAEENAFLVAYPLQPSSANMQGCWNWFEPRHQASGSGEPESLAHMTRAVLDEFKVSDAYIAGLSAGGAMAALMGEAYPDLYKAVGIHSGLAPCSATDVTSAFAAMRGNGQDGPVSTHRVPVIIFQGSADTVVHASNADAILKSGGAGEPDGAPETMVIGDRTVLKTTYEAGRIEVWRISGGGHAWAGGDSKGSFTDPTGPDASREMMRFFLKNQTHS